MTLFEECCFVEEEEDFFLVSVNLPEEGWFLEEEGVVFLVSVILPDLEMEEGWFLEEDVFFAEEGFTVALVDGFLLSEVGFSFLKEEQDVVAGRGEDFFSALTEFVFSITLIITPSTASLLILMFSVPGLIFEALVVVEETVVALGTTEASVTGVALYAG